MINDTTPNRQTQYLPDGTFYVGPINAKGEKHGNGVIYNQNKQAIFEGFFINGQINGIGKCTIPYGNSIDTNSNIYEGNFLFGKINGNGTISYKPTSIPEKDDIMIQSFQGSVDENGNPIEGIMNIESMYIGYSQIKLEGTFNNGLLNGLGKIKYINRRSLTGDTQDLVFKGNFENGKRNGEGTFNDGRKTYTMSFNNDVCSDSIKIGQSNGIEYEGQFQPLSTAKDTFNHLQFAEEPTRYFTFNLTGLGTKYIYDKNGNLEKEITAKWDDGTMMPGGVQIKYPNGDIEEGKAQQKNPNFETVDFFGRFTLTTRQGDRIPFFYDDQLGGYLRNTQVLNKPENQLYLVYKNKRTQEIKDFNADSNQKTAELNKKKEILTKQINSITTTTKNYTTAIENISKQQAHLDLSQYGEIHTELQKRYDTVSQSKERLAKIDKQIEKRPFLRR